MGTEIVITRHAEQRMVERCGLNRKSMMRICKKAYEQGIPLHETKGSLRKWLNERYEANEGADNIRLYGDKSWIFSGTTLITVLQIPAELVKKAQAMKK